MTVPSFPLGPDGVWREVAGRSFPPGSPALFLDRDGVIVEEVGWLHRIGDVRLRPGIAGLIRAANRAGAPVAVVTNQSGVGRGLYGWAEFATVQRAIAARLALGGAAWDAVFASPFPPDDDRPMRKPRPGMLLAAAEAIGLDLAASWIVGDRATDIEAGLRAGLRGGLFVGDGYVDGEPERAMDLARAGFSVRRIRGPGEAASHLPFLGGA